MEKLGVGFGQPKGDRPGRSIGDDPVREVARFGREAATGSFDSAEVDGADRTLHFEEAFDRTPEIIGLDELPVRIVNPGP